MCQARNENCKPQSKPSINSSCNISVTSMSNFLQPPTSDLSKPLDVTVSGSSSIQVPTKIPPTPPKKPTKRQEFSNKQKLLRQETESKVSALTATIEKLLGNNENCNEKEKSKIFPTPPSRNFNVVKKCSKEHVSNFDHITSNGDGSEINNNEKWSSQKAKNFEKEKNDLCNTSLAEVHSVSSRLLPKYLEDIKQYSSEQSQINETPPTIQQNSSSQINVEVYSNLEKGGDSGNFQPKGFKNNINQSQKKIYGDMTKEVLCRPKASLPRPSRPPPLPPKKTISTKIDASSVVEGYEDSPRNKKEITILNKPPWADPFTAVQLEEPPSPPPKDYLVHQYREESLNQVEEVFSLSNNEKLIKEDFDYSANPSRHYQNFRKEAIKHIFDGTTLSSESTASPPNLLPKSKTMKIVRENDTVFQKGENNAGLSYSKSLPQFKRQELDGGIINSANKTEISEAFKPPSMHTVTLLRGNKLKVPDNLEQLISQSLQRPKQNKYKMHGPPAVDESLRHKESENLTIPIYPKNVEDILYDYTLHYEEVDEGNLDSALSISQGQKSKLNHLVEELIASEESYIAALEKVILVYKPYLEERFSRGRALHEISLLFGNIEEIYEESKELLKSLKRQPDVKGVATAYAARQSTFELYPLYAKNKSTSDIYYNKFKEIIKKKQVELGDALDLASYLLSPIQRPAKQLLLLENIKKELDRSDESYLHIRSAINMIKKELRKGEDLLASGLIMNAPRGLISQASYIMKEDFEMIKPKRKRVVVFLFKHVLILTNPLENSEKCEYFSHIFLERLRVPPSSKDPQQLLLDDYMLLKEEQGKKLSYVLKAKTVKSKEIWSKILNENLWEQMKEVKERHTVLAGQAQMVQEEEVSSEETSCC